LPSSIIFKIFMRSSLVAILLNLQNKIIASLPAIPGKASAKNRAGIARRIFARSGGLDWRPEHVIVAGYGYPI
jgi:hypothetical protein